MIRSRSSPYKLTEHEFFVSQSKSHDVYVIAKVEKAMVECWNLEQVYKCMIVFIILNAYHNPSYLPTQRPWREIPSRWEDADGGGQKVATLIVNVLPYLGQ